MSDEPVQSDEMGSDGGTSSPERGWRDLWQAPLLVLGTLLLVTGVIASLRAQPAHDFDSAMDDVEALIQRESHREALQLLNDEILPYLAEDESAPSRIRARFHLLRADAIFLAQAAMDLNNPANHRAVVEEYNAAEQLLATLSPQRVSRYASSLVALGREGEAITMVTALPDESADVRHAIFKRIIEESLETPGGDTDKVLELLSEMTSDPTLTAQDRIWTVVTQARLRLDGGYVEEALDHLLLALQRLESRDTRHAAELYLLLARAYEELGRLEDAQRNIERAVERLVPTDRLMAEAHVLAGRIAQSRGRFDEARERYAQVVADFTGHQVWRAALLGLAETEATVGETAMAFESFRRLAMDVIERGDVVAVTRRMVEESLLDQVAGALAREDYAAAHTYAEIAQDMYVSERPTPAISLALARSQRLLADETLASVRQSSDTPPDLSQLDPVTRAEVKAKYDDAGEHFLVHARDMILLDDEAFADSLWNAAECFDLAGDVEKAIEVFSEYANGRPNDPRRPAAVFRLAQAHQSRGDYAVAAQFYRELIEENPNSGEGTRSYVWLARTYLQDDDPSNDVEAERLLRRIVDGGLLAPDAIDFRTALMELGVNLYRRSEYAEAIRRLDEAVRRFPQDREIDQLRFWLADAHRRRAEELAETLKQAMPDARRRGIEQQRRDHLTTAMDLFERVRRDLHETDQRRLTELQRTMLRNTYFFKADCAFDLRDFERAIEFYDTAAQRYADHPISLVAMAQIASAFIEQGRIAEARKANDRARQRLHEFPDDVFESRDLPLSRKHWERWLDSTDALSRGSSPDDRRTVAADSNE